MLSVEVVWSLYVNVLSVLIEYPTPAGDSMKSRCDSLSQEYGF